MNATILKFPHDRINLEVKTGEAKIIKLPIKQVDVVFLMPLAMAGLFLEMWTTAF